MIKEGCLEGVDEVYGYHNQPHFDEGDIRVCPGAIYAHRSTLKIQINGCESHASKGHDPIAAMCNMY